MAISLVVFVPVALSAGNGGLRWDVEDVAVKRQRDSLRLTVSLRFSSQRVKAGHAVAFVSSAEFAGGEVVPLRPLSIRGVGRAPASPVTGDPREISYLSENFATPVDLSTRIAIPERPDTFSVFVEAVTYNVKGAETGRERREVARFSRRRMPSFKAELGFVDYAEGRNHKDVHQLYLFPSGGSSVDEDSSVVVAARDEFVSCYETVIGSPYVTMNGVTLIGWSDLSGSVFANKSASMRRAQSAERFLREEGIFKPLRRRPKIEAAGEDMDAFRRWVSQSYWSRDDELRMMMASAKNPDDMETKIKSAYPDLWEAAGEVLFPSMKRVDVVLDYDVAPFASVADMRKAYESSPAFLSIGDCISLSKELSRGSNEMSAFWMEVAAARADDEAANINVVVSLLDEGHYRDAGRYLRFCGNGEEAEYLRAVWLALEGNFDEAYDILCLLPPGNGRYDGARASSKAVLDWMEKDSDWDRELIRYVAVK